MLAKIKNIGLLNDKKMLFGLIGILSPIVVFTIWVGMFMKQIEEPLRMVLSFGRMFGMNLLGNPSVNLVHLVATKAFFMASGATIALFFALWLVGFKQSYDYEGIHQFIYQVGSKSYYSVLGFILAILMIGVNWPLSIAVIVVNLLLALLNLFLASATVFNIYQRRQALFVFLSFNLFLLVTVIFSVLIF